MYSKTQIVGEVLPSMKQAGCTCRGGRRGRRGRRGAARRSADTGSGLSQRSLPRARAGALLARPALSSARLGARGRLPGSWGQTRAERPLRSSSQRRCLSVTLVSWRLGPTWLAPRTLHPRVEEGPCWLI